MRFLPTTSSTSAEKAGFFFWSCMGGLSVASVPEFFEHLILQSTLLCVKSAKHVVDTSIHISIRLGFPLHHYHHQNATFKQMKWHALNQCTKLISSEKHADKCTWHSYFSSFSNDFNNSRLLQCSYVPLFSNNPSSLKMKYFDEYSSLIQYYLKYIFNHLGYVKYVGGIFTEFNSG